MTERNNAVIAVAEVLCNRTFCGQETAARVNQSALEAVTPSPSFQQRHESFRPSMSVSVNTHTQAALFSFRLV